MLGRIDMRFNPKSPPLDSGSGAGMTVYAKVSIRGKNGGGWVPAFARTTGGAGITEDARERRG